MPTGDRIAKLRSDAHMSQFQLAKVLGIGTSTLGMYETNKRKPSPKILNRIADYFNVSTDYLLGRDNKEKATKKGMSLDEALDSVMSYDGSPVTDHDRETMKNLWKAYLDSKK